MVIDTHTHLWSKEIPSDDYWVGFVKISAKLAGRPEEKVRERLPGWWDLSGDLLVQDMDEAEIDKSVLLPIDWYGFAGTEESVSLDRQHRIFAEAVNRHPERLILFGAVNPKRPAAAQFVERAVKEWAIKGLKMHPCYGQFYPNEPECYLVYEKAQELGLVISMHTGHEIYPAKSKYAQPIYLDEVAVDFPDLRIILDHVGNPYWLEAASIANNKPNVYVDLAWWQPKILGNSVENFYKPLRTIIDTVGVSRVLFGSDWPALRQVSRLRGKVWVDAFKNPPEVVKEAGIEFTEQEMNAILGDNAAKLLAL